MSGLSLPVPYMSSPQAQAEGSGINNNKVKKSEITQARRNAVDFHAGSKGVRTDLWHFGMKAQVVCLRTCDYHALDFWPTDDQIEGTLAGVALTECEYGGGNALAHRDEPASRFLDPSVMKEGGRAPIRITWPGYAHTRYQYIITVNTNMGDVASQVASVFRMFFNQYHGHFKGPGIQLGPHHVTYEQLRLRCIWWDGNYWNLEISYVFEGDVAWKD